MKNEVHDHDAASARRAMTSTMSAPAATKTFQREGLAVGTGAAIAAGSTDDTRAEAT